MPSDSRTVKLCTSSCRFEFTTAFKNLLGFILISFVVSVVAVRSDAQDKPPASDANYQRFFSRFVNKRSIPADVLTSVGLPDSLVGRSFALVVGVSHYPKLGLGSQVLEPAGVDLDNLVRYLQVEEFFDEIVV